MKLEDLNIYNQANELGDAVWLLVDKWNFFKKDTIGKQLVRSADSVAANIAEGYGRFFYKENRNFCYYSRGSLLETKTWLGKASRRNIIEKEVYNKLVSDVDSLHKSLNAYIKYISDQTKKVS